MEEVEDFESEKVLAAYPALWKAADWDPAFLEVMVTALQETPPTPNRKIHSGDSYAP